MREIEKTGLLRSLDDFHLELVVGQTKLPLDLPATGGKQADHQREQDEKDEVRAIGSVDVERVAGVRKEVVEGHARERDRKGARSPAPVPDRHRDAHQEKRKRQVGELIALGE